MWQKIPDYAYAKYRAFAPISCFDSPRSDILCGWRRWQWLVRQRRGGKLIEPSVRIHGDVRRVDECLSLEKGTYLDQGVIVWIGSEGGQIGRIQLAQKVYVGPYVFLGASSHRLEIGEDTMVGAQSYIITENHVTARKDVPYARQGYVGANIIIGRNVWIGCHVTILPGVTIGDNAVIGAGAVVTKDVPGNETWAGVPAKRLAQT